MILPANPALDLLVNSPDQLIAGMYHRLPGLNLFTELLEFSLEIVTFPPTDFTSGTGLS